MKLETSESLDLLQFGFEHGARCAQRPGEPLLLLVLLYVGLGLAAWLLLMHREGGQLPCAAQAGARVANVEAAPAAPAAPLAAEAAR